MTHPSDDPSPRPERRRDVDPIIWAGGILAFLIVALMGGVMIYGEANKFSAASNESTSMPYRFISPAPHAVDPTR